MSQEKQVALINSQVPQVKQNNTLIHFCRNNEEVNLINALTLSQSEADYTNDLIDVLAKWRWMSGINTTNQDENDLAKELVLLANFVKGNYKSITIDEINLAIDLSLTDKLDCDVRTFNVFSPMYVSRILNAYLSYKRNIVKDVIERKRLKEQTEDMNRKPSPQERMDGVIDLIKYFYEKFQENGVVDDYFNSVYLFMFKNKLINPSEKTIEESLEYGKDMARKENSDNIFNALTREKPNRELLETRYSRNYIVQKYFKTFGIDKLISEIKISLFE